MYSAFHFPHLPTSPPRHLAAAYLLRARVCFRNSHSLFTSRTDLFSLLFLILAHFFQFPCNLFNQFRFFLHIRLMCCCSSLSLVPCFYRSVRSLFLEICHIQYLFTSRASRPHSLSLSFCHCFNSLLPFCSLLLPLLLTRLFVAVRKTNSLLVHKTVSV